MDEGGRWHAAYDLVWCCEFVEHVEERYVPNIVPSLSLGTLVAMTHAVPGQGGHHHVNCRTSDYWIGVMAAIGYQLDNALTAIAKNLAGREKTIPRPANYFAQTGKVFRRVD